MTGMYALLCGQMAGVLRTSGQELGIYSQIGPLRNLQGTKKHTLLWPVRLPTFRSGGDQKVKCVRFDAECPWYREPYQVDEFECEDCPVMQEFREYLEMRGEV